MIHPLSFLLKQPAAELATGFVESSDRARSFAVNAAKCLIALVDVLGSEAKAREAVTAAGASESTVKNAMQLVWAYDEVVRPGHADEAWFDSLLYAHAVAVRAAVRKVGAKKLADAGLFNKAAKCQLVEFELVAETGLLKAERIAKSDKEIADKQAAEAKAKAAKPAAEDQSVEAKAPATKAAETAAATLTVSPGGDQKPSPVPQFDKLITTAEAFFAAVLPTADEVTVETLKARVASMMVKIDAAVAAKAAAAKVAKTA